MKMSVRILSALVCLVLLFCSFGFAGAENEPAANECPVIFIKGFAATPIIDPSGKQLFPPDVAELGRAAAKELSPIIRGVITGNYSLLRGPVDRLVDQAFRGIAFDENGLPAYSTGVAYLNPTPAEIALKKHDGVGYTAEDPIFYCFDWRFDLKTLAAGLDEFIEYVLENTEAQKVRIIASSMGSSVLMTYLHDYEYKNVDSFILLESAFNGAAAAGSAFCGELELDSASAIRYFDALLGTEFGPMFARSVLNAMYQTGDADRLIGTANNIIGEIYVDLLTGALGRVCSGFPGMWALVPYEQYDRAMEVMFPDGISDELKEKIGYFHNEIQPYAEQITQGAKEAGIDFAIVAKYGYLVPPVAEGDADMTGDILIDTVSASFGARCADAGAVLDADSQTVNDGHEHMSADGMIDASTCLYPENTWFIKNINHMEHPLAELSLCEYLLSDGPMKTVFDSPSHPQFLIFNENELEPLTTENDYSRYNEPYRSPKFFERLKSFFAAFIAAIRVLFKR